VCRAVGGRFGGVFRGRGLDRDMSSNPRTARFFIGLSVAAYQIALRLDPTEVAVVLAEIAVEETLPAEILRGGQ